MLVAYIDLISAVILSGEVVGFHSLGLILDDIYDGS